MGRGKRGARDFSLHFKSSAPEEIKLCARIPLQI